MELRKVEFLRSSRTRVPPSVLASCGTFKIEFITAKRDQPGNIFMRVLPPRFSSIKIVRLISRRSLECHSCGCQAGEGDVAAAGNDGITPCGSVGLRDSAHCTRRRYPVSGHMTNHYTSRKRMSRGKGLPEKEANQTHQIIFARPCTDVLCLMTRVLPRE